MGGTTAEDHTGICTIKLCITALGLHDKPPSSCYFKHTVGKRSKHCRYSLDNQKSGSNMENNGALTTCGNTASILHEEQSHLSWGRRSAPARWVYHHLLFLLGSTSRHKHKKKTFPIWFVVDVCYFWSLFFPVLAIYRVGAVRGWESGVLQESTAVGFWLWSLLYLARYEWVPVWACWSARCPEGNETTAHNFLMPPTHMCTFLVCDSSKQELAVSRGNGFLWLK